LNLVPQAVLELPLQEMSAAKSGDVAARKASNSDLRKSGIRRGFPPARRSIPLT
jgi:hypothetical protein